MYKKKKGQASIEYLIIVGFVVFVLIVTLGIAFFYSGSIKDRIRFMDLSGCASKIISSSESVFYAGNPSKTTISCYLPDNIKEINITENSLIFSIQTNSGISKTAFSSNVPISGNIPTFSGSRKIIIQAQENTVSIGLA